MAGSLYPILLLPSKITGFLILDNKLELFCVLHVAQKNNKGIKSFSPKKVMCFLIELIILFAKYFINKFNLKTPSQIRICC